MTFDVQDHSHKLLKVPHNLSLDVEQLSDRTRYISGAMSELTDGERSIY